MPEILRRIGADSTGLIGLVKIALLNPNEIIRKSAAKKLRDEFQKEECTLEKAFIGDNQIFLICRDREGYQSTSYITDLPKKYHGKKLGTNFVIRDNQVYFE